MNVWLVGRRWAGVALGCLGILALSACGASSQAPAASAGAPGSRDAGVVVRLFQFQPSPLEVAAGAAVTWTNHDDTLHTVTSGTPGAADGRFDGSLAGKETTYTFTFSQPGTYAYFCSRHDSMQGEVRVQ